ncbi:MAG: hypothetical protein RLZZ118_663 [Bacteroidota bacterium]|jgi:hypothetical protein
MMTVLHPQFIKDTAGQNLVILPQSEFDDLLLELEDLEDVKDYKIAKSKDDSERIPMIDAFRMIEDIRKT